MPADWADAAPHASPVAITLATINVRKFMFPSSYGFKLSGAIAHDDIQRLAATPPHENVDSLK